MSSDRERGVAAEGYRMDDDGRARAYELMSHACRRALVDSLDRREEGIALADAASEVVSRNLDRPVSETSHGEVAQVYAALLETHLPQLVEAGVVAHDRDRNVVSLTDRGRELAGLRVGVATTDDDDIGRAW